ncbi:hypothetical protein [Sphingorhabdus sp. M41]|uniref:hypothetical protein n=1 Tax=Sphingorhabdus sp. M41 TaxID=1806885 RepID=UPI0012E88D38|nr:hypothetical protein [Sphingorhabdus sp. M41]
MMKAYLKGRSNSLMRALSDACGFGGQHNAPAANREMMSIEQVDPAITAGH